jgi:hypothetical protein
VDDGREPARQVAQAARRLAVARWTSTMRIRRDLLFGGLFLIPVGAITLLVRAGTIDAGSLLDAWRLWPLILVGIGIAIVVGRSRMASLGTAVVALVLGAIVGSAVASGNIWIGGVTECGPTGAAIQHFDRSGTFSGTASLELDFRCGSIGLSTGSGDGWKLAADHQGSAPIVTASADRLALRVPAGPGLHHHDWTIQAPSSRLGSVQLAVSAGTGSLDLDGTTLRNVDVDANASDVRIDGGNAAIGTLEVTANAGRVRIVLGPSPTVGDLEVNAGALDVCAPVGSALRFDVNDQLTFMTNLGDRGLTRDGNIWTRTGTVGAPLIVLHIEGNAAGLTLDPAGGCR